MSKQKNFSFTDKDLRNLQLKSLEILLYFKDFCESNNLTFFLCGGCCIGTLRHGGFIPWDDDIDVFMPREDYERLAVLWNEKADTEKYAYCRPQQNVNYKNLFATINDNNTTFIKTHQADLDINHGIVLDILPLDGYPNSKIKRIYQVFWALIYSLFCAGMIPKNHGKFAKIAGAILLYLVKSRNSRYKIWRFAEKKMTKYKINDCNNITELCSGWTYMRKKYPVGTFKKAVYKNFEGYKMPIPVGYDTYLKKAFGDYMTMPPPERQVAHHNVVFCDLNNGYKKYRGKYYFKGDSK